MQHFFSTGLVFFFFIILKSPICYCRDKCNGNFNNLHIEEIFIAIYPIVFQLYNSWLHSLYLYSRDIIGVTFYLRWIYNHPRFMQRFHMIQKAPENNFHEFCILNLWKFWFYSIIGKNSTYLWPAIFYKTENSKFFFLSRSNLSNFYANPELHSHEKKYCCMHFWNMHFYFNHLISAWAINLTWI